MKKLLMLSLNIQWMQLGEIQKLQERKKFTKIDSEGSGITKEYRGEGG